jgi:ZU5 domain
MRYALKSWAAVLCCCGALSCSVNTTAGSKYAKTQQVSALSGGTVAVTSADDPALAGLKLLIPPGALAQDTLITVAEGNSLVLPDGALAVGPVADLGPTDATFSRQVTVVMPFALATGQSTDGLAIQGTDSAGNSVHVSNADLTIDAVAHTVSFTVGHLHRFAPLFASPNQQCPNGERFCGCCGNGACQPAGTVCPAIACPSTCAADAGSPTGGGGGSGGGRSCCPAGESWCGCGASGQCIPAGSVCPLACPADASPSPSVTPPSPTCCGAGEYLCGCGGIGQCIPFNQACPLTCPVCGPNLVPSPCGCIAPGAVCQCDPTRPSTVPCQCNPSTATPNSANCVVDAGNPCPDATQHMTACGCLPAGAICGGSADAGSANACSSTQRRCCDGRCVGLNEVCTTLCLNDGGVTSVDGGTCGPSTVHCPNTAACVPAGMPCPQ